MIALLYYLKEENNEIQAEITYAGNDSGRKHNSCSSCLKIGCQGLTIKMAQRCESVSDRTVHGFLYLANLTWLVYCVII